ncbi:hypothetical protein D3C81_1776640 [compost metagenome]
MKVAMVPKPIEPKASPEPWGSTRPSTWRKGMRSPTTMGAACLGQASMMPMAASRMMLAPMLHKPYLCTRITPSGAPMASAP